jgi:hypothetical protein
MQDRDVAQLEEMASDSGHEASDAALWMLLLLRLTKVTADERLELRNSEYTTHLPLFRLMGHGKNEAKHADIPRRDPNTSPNLRRAW